MSGVATRSGGVTFFRLREGSGKPNLLAVVLVLAPRRPDRHLPSIHPPALTIMSCSYDDHLCPLNTLFRIVQHRSKSNCWLNFSTSVSCRTTGVPADVAFQVLHQADLHLNSPSSHVRQLETSERSFCYCKHICISVELWGFDFSLPISIVRVP